MKKTIIILVVLLVLLGGFFWILRYFNLSCDESCAPPLSEPSSSLEGTVEYEIETVAENLEVPWSIVFTSNDRILVTERPGRIRAVVNGAASAPLKTFPETYAQSEAGLMGLALDPMYATNKHIYVSIAYLKEDTPTVKIVRLTDEGSALTNETVILDNIPAARNHAGNRIAFGPDQKLYITTGDATDRSLAQNRQSLAGKILRINKDGSIPADNPFQGSLVFSLGHRNPQGLDWDETQFGLGRLWSSEHGPSVFDGPAGGDEINQIEAGKNYGWPIISHEESQEGLEDPEAVFTPAVAPSGIVFYFGSVFPQLHGKLLFAGLRGEGLYALTLSADRSTVASYEKLDVEVGRVRDVTEGPDGLIYFTSSNRDGRGDQETGDDKIYRLVPKQ